MSIAVHGWSEAQHDPQIRDLIARFYIAFRERLAQRVGHWRDLGRMPATLDAGDVAQALLSQILGFVVQKTIVAGTDSAAITRGLDALGRSQP